MEVAVVAVEVVVVVAGVVVAGEVGIWAAAEAWADTVGLAEMAFSVGAGVCPAVH